MSDSTPSVSDEAEGSERLPARKDESGKDLPLSAPVGIARFAFGLVWFFVLPLGFALTLVWTLSPGVEVSANPGIISSVIRDQPVPFGIVLFTLAEMGFFAIRDRLPFAKLAYPPPRPGLKKEFVEGYERALRLLTETETLLNRHANAVKRTVKDKQRAALDDSLAALRAEMVRPVFEGGAFGEALDLAEKRVGATLGSFRKSEGREFLESIGVAVAVAMALRLFVVEAFKIPSESMVPTLQVGDHIFVNKFIYGPSVPFTNSRFWKNLPPRRGDVMVFQFPENMEQDYIKRVIAIPGDKLEAFGGHPHINGWKVPNCFVGATSYQGFASHSTDEGDLYIEYLEGKAYATFYNRNSGGGPNEYEGPFTVKPGEIWAMGDNRNNSQDSRKWWGGRGGGVPYENIKGKAWIIWLSFTERGNDFSRLGGLVMGRPRLLASQASLEPALTKCLREQPPYEQTIPPPPSR